jgi:orotate phosphoribosyltransferase
MSSLKAVDALREVNASVIGVVAIFDYGFPKAKEAFQSAQCPYKTLSNYPALLSEAVNSGYITQKEENILKIWNQDPEAWAKKNT